MLRNLWSFCLVLTRLKHENERLSFLVFPDHFKTVSIANFVLPTPLILCKLTTRELPVINIAITFSRSRSLPVKPDSSFPGLTSCWRFSLNCWFFSFSDSLLDAFGLKNPSNKVRLSSDARPCLANNWRHEYKSCSPWSSNLPLKLVFMDHTACLSSSGLSSSDTPRRNVWRNVSSSRYCRDWRHLPSRLASVEAMSRDMWPAPSDVFWYDSWLTIAILIMPPRNWPLVTDLSWYYTKQFSWEAFVRNVFLAVKFFFSSTLIKFGVLLLIGSRLHFYMYIMPWHIVFSEELCPFPSVSRRTRFRYRFINFLPLLTIRYSMSVRCAVQSATSFSETMYFPKNSDCLFIPCFELTLLKHLF